MGRTLLFIEKMPFSGSLKGVNKKRMRTNCCMKSKKIAEKEWLEFRKFEGMLGNKHMGAMDLMKKHGLRMQDA